MNRLTDIEFGLFYFSNILGAIFTYVLMQALGQDNPVLHREYHRKGPYYMNDKRKDRLVRQWIDGFLSGLLAYAPSNFRDLIYKITGRYTNSENRVKSFVFKKPSLSIDDPEVVRLGSEAFHNIYPRISYTLNKISAHLADSVNSQKDLLERIEKSESPSLHAAPIEENERNKKERRSKLTHTHKFKLFKVKADVKHFQCETCHQKKSEPIVTP